MNPKNFQKTANGSESFLYTPFEVKVGTTLEGFYGFTLTHNETGRCMLAKGGFETASAATCAALYFAKEEALRAG
jgi:hypothetical protein